MHYYYYYYSIIIIVLFICFLFILFINTILYYNFSILYFSILQSPYVEIFFCSDISVPCMSVVVSFQNILVWNFPDIFGLLYMVLSQAGEFLILHATSLWIQKFYLVTKTSSSMECWNESLRLTLWVEGSGSVGFSPQKIFEMLSLKPTGSIWFLKQIFAI